MVGFVTRRYGYERQRQSAKRLGDERYYAVVYRYPRRWLSDYRRRGTSLLKVDRELMKNPEDDLEKRRTNYRNW